MVIFMCIKQGDRVPFRTKISIGGEGGRRRGEGGPAGKLVIIPACCPQGCDPFPNARIARESSTCHPFLVLFAQVDRFTHFSHTIPWFILMSALKTDSKIYFSSTILSTLGSVLALPSAQNWANWYFLSPAIFVDETLMKMVKNTCFFINAGNRRIFMEIMQNPPVPGFNEKTWNFDEKWCGSSQN